MADSNSDDDTGNGSYRAASETTPLVNDSRYFRPILVHRVSPVISEDDDSITVRRPITYASRASDSNIQTSAAVNRYRYYGRLEPSDRSSLIMPNHVVPSDYCEVIPVTVDVGGQHSIVTIFSLWNTMLGTSMLSMPYALEQAGFGLGLGLMIFMAGLMLFTADLIVKLTHRTAIDGVGSANIDFSLVCRHYLGRWAEIVSVIFSVISLVGAAMVYWILMSNFLFHTVSYIYDKADGNTTSVVGLNGSILDVQCRSTYVDPSQSAPPWSFYYVWRQYLTVPLLLILILFPLANFKSPTFFTKFNALGTISILFILTFVCVKSGEWGFHANFSSQDPADGIPEFQKTFPKLTGILSLAYYVHNAVVAMLRNQRNPENNSRDLTIAYICVAFTYIFVAVFFYLCFPLAKTCITDNLLNNFTSSDLMTFIARIFLFFQMMTVFPLLMYITRIQIFGTFLGNIYPGLKWVVALNVCITVLCVLMAIFEPNISVVISFAGAACGLVYVFTLPSVIDIVSRYQRQRYVSIARIALHAIIILIGIANFIAQFVMYFAVSTPSPKASYE